LKHTDLPFTLENKTARTVRHKHDRPSEEPSRRVKSTCVDLELFESHRHGISSAISGEVNFFGTARNGVASCPSPLWWFTHHMGGPHSTLGFTDKSFSGLWSCSNDIWPLAILPSSPGRINQSRECSIRQCSHLSCGFGLVAVYTRLWLVFRPLQPSSASVACI